MIRKLVPKSLKLLWQLFKRARRDKQSGYYKNLATHKGDTSKFYHKISVTQPIKNNVGAANKVHNIKLAFASMEHLIIKPSEYFSYWHTVPAPIAKNGFKKGRNLLAGKLQEDYGGGLCQLSGMLYIAALKAGLDIKERHHHSIDIYTEETRYTPLGSDATVVYGYKDLRFTNNLNQAISIQLEFKENSLTLHLISDQPFVEQEISWNLVYQTDFKVVETRNGDGEVLAVSRYRT